MSATTSPGPFPITFEQLRFALDVSIRHEQRHRDTPQGFYDQERFEERPGLGDRWPPLEHDLRWIESEV